MTFMHNDIEIIFEDRDILVIKKPVGIPSENSQNGEKGLISYLINEKRKNLYLLHRLDKPVGGVMVFAKNKKSASELSVAIANGGFRKKYLAVTDGVPREESGIYKDLLFRDSRGNRSFVVDRMRKGVKEAVLEYDVLQKTESKALVEVLLHTGRTHQIRVQFSSRKTPLTGDGRYGSKERGCDIALFSREIAFLHPTTEKEIIFRAEPDYKKYPWSCFEVNT